MMMKKKNELIALDDIGSSLAKNSSFDELNMLRAKVEAIRVLSKQSKLSLKSQNKIAEYRLRIDRKRGEWLSNNVFRSGNGSNQHVRKELRSHPHTLAEYGVTRTESSILQRIASIPAADFEEHIDDIKANSEELTTAGLLRLEAALRFAGRKMPSLPKGKFNVIYADPPWAYQSDHTRIKNVKLIYPTMSIEELCAFGEKVTHLAAEDCTLFLWVPSPQLDKFPAVLEAWGFRFCTTWVWNKLAHNFGFYGSIQHEILIIGGRGRATPTCDPKVLQSIRSVQSIKKTAHSAKPSEYYDLIEKAYPGRRYLELFSRAKDKRRGWTFWGDECR